MLWSDNNAGPNHAVPKRAPYHVAMARDLRHFVDLVSEELPLREEIIPCNVCNRINDAPWKQIR